MFGEQLEFSFFPEITVNDKRSEKIISEKLVSRGDYHKRELPEKIITLRRSIAKLISDGRQTLTTTELIRRANLCLKRGEEATYFPYTLFTMKEMGMISGPLEDIVENADPLFFSNTPSLFVVPEIYLDIFSKEEILRGIHGVNDSKKENRFSRNLSNPGLSHTPYYLSHFDLVEEYFNDRKEELQQIIIDITDKVYSKNNIFLMGSREDECESILLTIMGTPSIPNYLKERYKDQFSDLETSLEDPIYSDNISVRRRTCGYVGVCEQLEETLEQICFCKRSVHYKSGLVISVDKTPVGLLKYHGDQSMIALRTVRDKKTDTPVLVEGASYALDYGVVYGDYETKDKKEGDFSRIELESLTVRPLRFAYDANKTKREELLKEIKEVI